MTFRCPLPVRIAALVCIATCSFAALSAQDDPGLYHDNKAKDLFVAARIAITGGPGGLARLQSMRLKGRSQFSRPDGTPFAGSVEVRILLPDRYLRIDSGSFGRRLAGYAGTTPLFLVEDADKKILTEPKDAASVASARFELARLMLGMAAWVSREVQVKLYTRDTPVDMPGAADPLGVGAVGDNDRFAARVVFDVKSRMPARVVYRAGEGTVMTTAFLDRRSVAGYRIPSRLVTTAGDGIVDELMFDEIVVNPSFSKADFTK